jgi:hypothetical protein
MLSPRYLKPKLFVLTYWNWCSLNRIKIPFIPRIIIIQVGICIWCYSLFLYLDKFLDAHFMYWFDINFIHFWNILLLHCLDRPFFCLFIISPKFFVLNSCRKHMLAKAFCFDILKLVQFKQDKNPLHTPFFDEKRYKDNAYLRQIWNFSVHR